MFRRIPGPNRGGFRHFEGFEYPIGEENGRARFCIKSENLCLVDSLDRIREGLTEGREVPVFVDRTVSPSFVPDVARATRHLLEAGSVPGVYHCVNSGSATWLEVGEALARAMGVVPRFRGVRMAEATLKANRPVYCALSNRRLAAAGFPMPDWRDALTRWEARGV